MGKNRFLRTIEVVGLATLLNTVPFLKTIPQESLAGTTQPQQTIVQEQEESDNSTNSLIDYEYMLYSGSEEQLTEKQIQDVKELVKKAKDRLDRKITNFGTDLGKLNFNYFLYKRDLDYCLSKGYIKGLPLEQVIKNLKQNKSEIDSTAMDAAEAARYLMEESHRLFFRGFSQSYKDKDSELSLDGNRLTSNLLNKKLNCLSYSIMFSEVCDELGIPVYIGLIPNHAFLVYFDGVNYFNFDPQTGTFDNNLNGNNSHLILIDPKKQSDLESVLDYTALFYYDTVRDFERAKVLYDTIKRTNNDIEKSPYILFFEAKLRFMEGNVKEAYGLYKQYQQMFSREENDFNAFKSLMEKECDYKARE